MVSTRTAVDSTPTAGAGHGKRKTFDGNVAGGVREIDEHVAVGGELRIECERQHAALAA